jgi:hypothetical protein
MQLGGLAPMRLQRLQLRLTFSPIISSVVHLHLVIIQIGKTLQLRFISMLNQTDGYRAEVQAAPRLAAFQIAAPLP